MYPSGQLWQPLRRRTAASSVVHCFESAACTFACPLPLQVILPPEMAAYLACMFLRGFSDKTQGVCLSVLCTEIARLLPPLHFLPELGQALIQHLC